ncbi:GerAB/ArcD/ProY family transporter [Bacillus sp. SCS-151]|uniref:GerAB/ArcD/ProY family transporter n=1 Tax=Nanhaiella sioensis TaxID=3115293 RepID=UPI00397AF985
MQEKLFPYQVAILIYMTQISVGIFSLPRVTAEAFGTNGWIGISIVSMIFVVNILLIGLVFHYSKGKSIFQIFNSHLPNFLVKPFYIIIALIYSSLSILIAKNFQLIIGMQYYPTMPPSLFVIMVLLITYWLVRSGIYHIAKATVVFFITILIVFVLGYNLGEFRLTRLTPFIFEGEKELLKKGNQVALHFLGIEMSLFLIPYIAKLKGAFKPVLFSQLLLTFIYSITCLISFGFFSYDQLSNETYPLLTMFEYIEFPFIARVEGIVIHLFLFEVLITIIVFFWGADQLIQHAIPKISPRLSIICLLLVSFLCTIVVNTQVELEKWIYFLRSAEFIIAFLLPILLLLLISISTLRKKLKK